MPPIPLLRAKNSSNAPPYIHFRSLKHTCQLFLVQRGEIFIRILWNHCAHIRKCPKKNLPKIYEDNRKVSEDPPIIVRTQSQGIICQAQPLLLRKSENLLWRTVIYVHFSIRYCFEYKLHIYIFSRRLSDMAATTHIFQLGLRNWSIGGIEHEIEVFDSQAWELAGILKMSSSREIL